MLRLAIIDDEEETRQIMVNFIDWNTYGITVVGEASDGFAAYDLINSLRPDIVLIDIQMPGMTGLDVLEKIRSEDLISPAFIIMSGYDDFEFARRAVSLAAVEYLLKPFRPDDVIMAIQKSIKHLELIRSSYPDAPSPDSKKKSLAGNTIDFSLLHYPSREEHRLLECLKVGTKESVLGELDCFWNCLCELNGDTESRLNCAIILYVEVCRFLLERGSCFSAPYFENRDSSGSDSSQEIHQTLTSIVLDAISLLESGDVSRVYVNKAIQYIQAHYNENLSLDSVANEIELSSPYLSSLFSRILGTTFVNYIQSVRIQKAKELLCGTTMKVYEIAYCIGYDDEKYFSQVFRKTEGITPSQFRAQSSANPDRI